MSAMRSLLQQGQYRTARRLALEMAASAVSEQEWLEVSAALRHFEEPEALSQAFDGGGWRVLGSPDALAIFAQNLGFSGLYEAASECLDKSLAIDPAHSDSHYLRGLFRMFAGDSAGSLASIRRALQIRPYMANAHWLLAMQDDATSAPAHVAEMEGLRHMAMPGSIAQAYFDYSLHLGLHAMGRHEDAWHALASGHAAMRRWSPYDAVDQRALFGDLHELQLPDRSVGESGDGGTGLIFIVGMFRSGTTLIERLLSGHPDVVDGGETYQLSAALREASDVDGAGAVDRKILARVQDIDFVRVRERMLSYANWRGRGRKWLTEKLPSNFLNLGFILHVLPEARILHMRRDPVDTCFSNLRTIFQGGAPYACDQAGLAGYYVGYRNLMRHWHAVAPGRILDIDYDAFVADPEGQAKRVMAHCGLEYVPNALESGSRKGMAATASATHVRRGVLTDRSKVWTPYATHLRPLIDGLRPAYGEAIPG